MRVAFDVILSEERSLVCVVVHRSQLLSYGIGTSYTTTSGHVLADELLHLNVRERHFRDHGGRTVVSMLLEAFAQQPNDVRTVVQNRQS